MRKEKILLVILLITILCTGCMEEGAIQQPSEQTESIQEIKDEPPTCEGTGNRDVAYEEQKKEETIEETEPVTTEEYDFTLCFAGDINLDENWCTTQYLNTCENGIADADRGNGIP